MRVITYEIISLTHATRMIKKLNARKHSAFGFHFELTDLGCTIEVAQAIPALESKCYADYSPGNAKYQNAYRLVVYQDSVGQ